MSGSADTYVRDERIVFLHIGYFKTGSSALQEFFESNRDAFARRGIFYPKPNRDDFVVPFLHWRQGYVPGGEKEAFEELIQDASSCRYTILSNENFSFLHHEHAKSAIGKIAAYLSRIGRVKVIIYVRRQDELMQSSYIYNVMWQRMATTETGEFEANIARMVDEWAAVFGAENTIVRPYEKQQNAPNIFEDFFRSIGLPFHEDYELPKWPANVRIPDKFVEIKRNINLLYTDKAIQDQFMGIVRQMVQEFPQDKTYASHAYLSPQKRLEVLAQCAGWNEAVARKYLDRSDGRLFYDPEPDPDEDWKPFGGLQVEEAIALTARVFARYLAKVEASRDRHIAGEKEQEAALRAVYESFS